jgi:hypothetical protein
MMGKPDSLLALVVQIEVRTYFQEQRQTQILFEDDNKRDKSNNSEDRRINEEGLNDIAA